MVEYRLNAPDGCGIKHQCGVEVRILRAGRRRVLLVI